MKQHFLGSIKNHPWEVGSCAAIAGWLLSRIPARKKRVYIDSSTQQPVKRRDKGPLGKLWNEVWQFSKPMIAAYLAKLLVEHAQSSENEGLKTERLTMKSPKNSLKEINGNSS